jgi:hypothetical protein
METKTTGRGTVTSRLDAQIKQLQAYIPRTKWRIAGGVPYELEMHLRANLEDAGERLARLHRIREMVEARRAA